MPALATQAPVENLEATLKSFNLTQGEYQKIVTHLEREPNFNELAMFSVLWSEHCCYKNSRHLLKKLPTTGKRVLQGPGENAGVVDFGLDLDGNPIEVAFKIESHNHPTAVEPYQGAATGVGGILRDIFTMNARPIANLNALRFGPLSATDQTSETQAARNRYLFTHAVKGIGDYGNCVGVPTIAGDVFFEETYSGNPLVNAMSIGLLEGPLIASGASGVGNPILYVGSATGRDGMGGAAFASKELDENSHEDRPAVQVGDPFSEKLLIEACLEAFKTGCVVAAQDMGAAGLTSSSCEMAAKGGVGMRMDLDKVPAREPGMQAYEYMLSESQERMLFVLDKDRIQPVLDVFAKWHVPAVLIGEVIEAPNVEILHHGELVVNIPAALLTDLAPNYDRGFSPEEPAAFKSRRQQDPREGLPTLSWESVPGVLESLLKSSNIAQASPVFCQYDRHVQNNTLLASESSTSGVVRLRQKDGRFSGKALAATVDCNPVYVALHPYQGAMGAVVEAARNLACVGAEPVAVTDNLNFGNPEKPDIYYQLYSAVEGLKEACTVLETPITGGNVSLYNEHSGQAILPTPVVGMVGLIENDKRVMSAGVKKAGHQLALIGRFRPTLGGSQYQQQVAGKFYGAPPLVTLSDEKALQHLLLKLIADKTIQSAQDLSLGGLLVTLTEVLIPSRKDQPLFGAQLDMTLLQSLYADLTLDTLLFGETHGSVLVSYDAAQTENLIAACQQATGGVNQPLDCIHLGAVTDDGQLTVGETLTLALADAAQGWKNSLGKLLGV